MINMNSRELFKLALNIDDSWIINDITNSFSGQGINGRIDIYVTHITSKSRATDPAGNPDVRMKENLWYFNNIPLYELYIHALLPESNSAAEFKENLLTIPWVKDRSFTLLFEAYAMSMMETSMPVQDVAFTFGVNTMSINGMMRYWNNKKVVIENNLDGVCHSDSNENFQTRYEFQSYVSHGIHGIAS